VLDNDEDEDGDQLEITDVGNPSNGTAIAKDDDGDGVNDAISYTPSNSPDTVIFEYTISDGNGGTDTAEVTVNVTGDESSCGPLTVRVEGPEGNLLPGSGFRPKYDSNADGITTADEKLPERGQATGKFEYNVTVDATPRLSKMNEDLITQFPEGFATSVEQQEKDVEKTLTPSGPKEEPGDFIYPLQDRDKTKSKLATDPSGDDDDNGDDSDGGGGSCRTEDISSSISAGVSAQTINPDNPESRSDADSISININDSLSPGEYPESVSYDASLFTLTSGSCSSGCQATAEAYGEVDSPAISDKLSASTSGPGFNESSPSREVELTMGSTTSYNTINLSVNTSATSSNVNGSYADTRYAVIDNIQLKVCD
jgi:hypothetical protein